MCRRWRVFARDALYLEAAAGGFDFKAAGSAVWSGPNSEAHETLSADFNGDSKTDLARNIDNGTWQVCLSTGNFACSIWGSSVELTEHTVSGDFNGDGKTDLAGGGTVCLSSGSGFSCSAWPTPGFGSQFVPGQFPGSVKTIADDFNGDGKTDLARVKVPAPFITPQYGTSQEKIAALREYERYHDAQPWQICLSSGTGFSCSEWIGPGHNATTGDFNGDGKTDLVAYTFDNGYGTSGLWDVCLSSGSGFSCSYWAGHHGNTENNISADFNGDGKTDLAGWTHNGGTCPRGGDLRGVTGTAT